MLHTAVLFLVFILTLALSAFGTSYLIPVLKKLKAGQSIREDGPAGHQVKAGTPTMGGIAIVGSFIISTLAFHFVDKTNIKDALIIIMVTLLYGLIGFADDYIKVVKKRNLGLTAIQKIIAQTICSALLAIYGFINASTVYIPFFKVTVNFGWFYIPFIMFVVISMTNAVNLTDGLDGLSSSVTIVVSLFLMIITASRNAQSSLCASALIAACIGFLIYNRHPALVFMGDTGSLALGGALSAIAVVARAEFFLPIIGIVYVCEALSVIIQVAVFKTQNGRRFFRMAPIHHHFELGGWTENKVVLVFSAVTLVFGLISLLG